MYIWSQELESDCFKSSVVSNTKIGNNAFGDRPTSDIMRQCDKESV